MVPDQALPGTFWYLLIFFTDPHLFTELPYAQMATRCHFGATVFTCNSSPVAAACCSPGLGQTKVQLPTLVLSLPPPLHREQHLEPRYLPFAGILASLRLIFPRTALSSSSYPLSHRWQMSSSTRDPAFELLAFWTFTCLLFPQKKVPAGLHCNVFSGSVEPHLGGS